MPRTTINLDDLNYNIRPKNGETLDEVLKRYTWFRTILQVVRKEVCHQTTTSTKY